MSDTTAYLAGCATTGVAALVLLVARVGMVTSRVDTETQLSDRIARIETATPARQTAELNEQALNKEIRQELTKQQELTEKLEEQLLAQEGISEELEAQLEAQEEKTKDLLARIQDYQRSVEDMAIDDRIAAATRPAAPTAPTPSVPLVWVGAGVVVVLILGGGGLILCTVLLILQAQQNRRMTARHMPMPMPRPMPPSSSYRYYDPSFLPPSQYPPQRPISYDYPPAPYDYTP